MSETLSVTIPSGSRILVAGDNHGNPKLLLKVLSDVNYTENTDFLVLLGDAIEKGPDNLGGLKLAYDLCAEKKRAFFVQGNVDRWCRRLFSGDVADALSYSEFRPDNTLTQAARRYGCGSLCAENYAEICEKFQAEFGRICAWLYSCPCAVESGELIFVHSGIGPGAADYLADSKLLLSNYDFHRTRRNDSGKWVICGHMPCYNIEQTGASHCPIVDEKNKIVFTDGGTIISTGQQNLTVIEKKQDTCRFSWVYADYFPTARVVEASNGSREPVVRTAQDDREYEFLSPGRYFSKIRLVKSGRTGYAKNELLVKQQCRCELNAFVRAEVGDRVGIIRGDLDGFAYVKSADGQLGFLPRRCIGI